MNKLREYMLLILDWNTKHKFSHKLFYTEEEMTKFIKENYENNKLLHIVNKEDKSYLLEIKKL